MTSHGSIPAHLEGKVDLAPGLSIFRFALARDFTFRPGQYATLWLTHRGKTTPRPYTITSSPYQTRVLEFYINLVAEGNLTPSLWDPEVLQGLQDHSPQTLVTVSGPKGLLLLDPADRRDLIFVASGTGLAPFISMLRQLNEDYLANPQQAEPRSVWVVHGVSYPANLGYREELEMLARETLRYPGRKLGVVYLPTISRPQMDPSWQGLKGRAETLFEDTLPPEAGSAGIESVVKGMFRTAIRPETHAVYVCGHPGTVENVIIALTQRGFEVGRDLKHEKYYN